MSRALTDEQVGTILRRLTVIRDRVVPGRRPPEPGSYAQGLADGMTMAYEHARAMIGDMIGEPEWADAMPAGAGAPDDAGDRRSYDSGSAGGEASAPFVTAPFPANNARPSAE